MDERFVGQNERRRKSRFSVNAPVTVFLGDRTVDSYSRDVSDRGVFFYLPYSDGEVIEGNFEFMLKFPPELTLSTWCSIHGQARLIRKEAVSGELTGIGAEILQYSFVGETVPRY